jgi:hypothetical protein
MVQRTTFVNLDSMSVHDSEVSGTDVFAEEPRATGRVPQMSFMWKYAEDNATETPETETNPATVSHSAHPHAPRARARARARACKCYHFVSKNSYQ